MSQVPPLEPFDCEGDAATLGLRWEKWKRGFELYLVTLNITQAEKQSAALLHVGGLALQDIYYNIPDEVVSEEEKDKVDVYKSTIKKLDGFFLPHQNKTYERHLFRQLKQEQGETFEKFLVRLRRQSNKCKFSCVEDNLIDQIVEKCLSKDLRKKILTLGDSVTLAKIISEANVVEAVDRQLNDYGQQLQPTSINKIDTKRRPLGNTGCSRCGSASHTGDSNICPAKSKKCLKCGFEGHFRNQCKTRASKRKPPTQSPITAKKPRLTMKNEDKPKPKTLPQKTNVDYIFHIDNDETLKCHVGGVEIELVIDSGSKSNILSVSTWDYLKQHNGYVMNQVAEPDKNFIGYGGSAPLTVIGSFDTDIQVGDQLQTGTFYVVKEGTRDLLGKDTAIALKVLKLGIEVNSE
ncbi:uncharacterized protein LOC134677371 [Cydia fagiglandana]|uniref:uncharacterized protein LOC134677371 n=1 Tax=Cydia fagiglandana TaxID=1458189 RepID=UPI002FEE1EA5